MKTKHTPGPWSVAETRHGYDTVIRETNSEPIVLAFISGYTKAEGTANSNLIAAAPDLLAALEALLDARKQGHYHGEWEEASAAIAKARGEA